MFEVADPCFHKRLLCTSFIQLTYSMQNTILAHGPSHSSRTHPVPRVSRLVFHEEHMSKKINKGSPTSKSAFPTRWPTDRINTNARAPRCSRANPKPAGTLTPHRRKGSSKATNASCKCINGITNPTDRHLSTGHSRLFTARHHRQRRFSEHFRFIPVIRSF